MSERNFGGGAIVMSLTYGAVVVVDFIGRVITGDLWKKSENMKAERGQKVKQRVIK